MAFLRAVLAGFDLWVPLAVFRVVYCLNVFVYLLSVQATSLLLPLVLFTGSLMLCMSPQLHTCWKAVPIPYIVLYGLAVSDSETVQYGYIHISCPMAF